MSVLPAPAAGDAFDESAGGDFVWLRSLDDTDNASDSTEPNYRRPELSSPPNEYSFYF